MQSKGLKIPTSGETTRKGVVQPQDSLLHQAWDLYYTVFKRINAELATITSLDLQHVSPSLLSAKDFDLGVPGTYSVSGPSHFCNFSYISQGKQ